VAEGGALLRRYGGTNLHRGFESLLLRLAFLAGRPAAGRATLSFAGGVAERSNAAVSKTVSGGFVRRGFKSLPLRLTKPKVVATQAIRVGDRAAAPGPRLPLETARNRSGLAPTGAQLAHRQTGGRNRRPLATYGLRIERTRLSSAVTSSTTACSPFKELL
jgi:hypothetical protein